MGTSAVQTALGKLDAVKDVLSVQRVFGEPYHEDGVTVIPVVALRGGGGGGGGEERAPAGEGEGPGAGHAGSGSGVGFGVVARPVGVFVVREGRVRWVPAVDAIRVILGGQLLTAFAVLVVGRVLRHRHRHHRHHHAAPIVHEPR